MGKRLSQAQIAALHGVSQQTVSYVVQRAGHSNAARIAARNRASGEDPRINDRASFRAWPDVRQIQRIRNQKLGGGDILPTNYTDSVPFGLRERQREDLTFWPPQEAKTKTLLIGK